MPRRNANAAVPQPPPSAKRLRAFARELGINRRATGTNPRALRRNPRAIAAELAALPADRRTAARTSARERAGRAPERRTPDSRPPSVHDLAGEPATTEGSPRAPGSHFAGAWGHSPHLLAEPSGISDVRQGPQARPPQGVDGVRGPGQEDRSRDELSAADGAAGRGTDELR